MIIIIDNYDSFTYNLYQAIASQYSATQVIRNDEITLNELKQLQPQAIIISPGPGRPEEAGMSIELIQKFAPTTPILGVCLGHQSIGMAFGAKVCLAEQPVHGKDVTIHHHGKGLYKNLPSPMTAGRYHSLIVSQEEFPSCLEIESTGPNGMIMGIKHRHYLCFGVQFHPESILTPEGDQLITNFLTIMKERNQ